MFYNPKTKEQKSRSELKAMLHAFIPASCEEVQGWHKLHTAPIPEYDPKLQAVQRGPIREIDGIYTITHVIKDRDPAEVREWAFAELRAARDSKLAETDKYLIPDYPITEAQRAALKEYRAALRELPQHDSAPFIGVDIPWPVNPLEAANV